MLGPTIPKHVFLMSNIVVTRGYRHTVILKLLNMTFQIFSPSICEDCTEDYMETNI